MKKRRWVWVWYAMELPGLAVLLMLLGVAPWLIGVLVTALAASDVATEWHAWRMLAAQSYMWQLAARLNVSDEQIKAWVPKYGTLDLAGMRRKEALMSWPDIRLVTAKLEEQLLKPAVESTGE